MLPVIAAFIVNFNIMFVDLVLPGLPGCVYIINNIFSIYMHIRFIIILYKQITIYLFIFTTNY